MHPKSETEIADAVRDASGPLVVRGGGTIVQVDQVGAVFFTAPGCCYARRSINAQGQLGGILDDRRQRSS